MRRKQLFKDLSVVLLFFLVVFGGYSGLKKFIELGEIGVIENKVAYGSLTQTDIDGLLTQKAKDFATTALAEYEAKIAAYPEPTVTLLHDFEIQETTDEATQTAVTQYVLRTGSDTSQFALQFTVETRDETGEDLMPDPNEYIVIWDPFEGIIQPCEETEGIFSCSLDLTNLETFGSVIVKNQYKETDLNLLLVREESQEEKDDKVLTEKGNKICEQYPEWDESECKKLANDRIWIGMSLDMVKYLRGNPSSTNVSNYGTGNSYQYCWYRYTPMCFYDEDGNGSIDSYN